MNIKNRLKKLESEVITEESPFCTCTNDGYAKFLLPGIVPGHAELAAETNCRECGKLKGEPLHCTFKINSNTPLMEGEA